jgi:hypothetical protein
MAAAATFELLKFPIGVRPRITLIIRLAHR